MNKLELLKQKFNNKCAYCSEEIQYTTEIDYINPEDKENIDNCLPVCVSCYVSKGSLSLEEFREKMESYMDFSIKLYNGEENEEDAEHKLKFHFETL